MWSQCCRTEQGVHITGLASRKNTRMKVGLGLGITAHSSESIHGHQTNRTTTTALNFAWKCMSTWDQIEGSGMTRNVPIKNMQSATKPSVMQQHVREENARRPSKTRPASVSLVFMETGANELWSARLCLTLIMDDSAVRMNRKSSTRPASLPVKQAFASLACPPLHVTSAATGVAQYLHVQVITKCLKATIRRSWLFSDVDLSVSSAASAFSG